MTTFDLFDALLRQRAVKSNEIVTGKLSPLILMLIILFFMVIQIVTIFYSAFIFSVPEASPISYSILNSRCHVFISPRKFMPLFFLQKLKNTEEAFPPFVRFLFFLFPLFMINLKPSAYFSCIINLQFSTTRNRTRLSVSNRQLPRNSSPPPNPSSSSLHTHFMLSCLTPIWFILSMLWLINIYAFA